VRSRLFLIAIFAAVAVVHSAHAQEKIKIGTALALTGGLADEGGKQAVAQRMWAKRVNAAGGIQVGNKKLPVELVEYDYQSDGNRAAQITEKLINVDKVSFLLAPYGSGHTKITATVAERYQVPIIACSASSESVFNTGNEYLFGTLASLNSLAEAMAQLFKSKMPNVRRIAILARDDVFPKSIAEATAKAAKAVGIDVVYFELYTIGTMDQTPAISSMKASKPDWILGTGYNQDLILLRKQMADLGLSAPIVSMVIGPAVRDFIDGVGPELSNNVTAVTWWHQSQNFEGIGPWKTSGDFYNDFKAENNAEPDFVNASCAAAPIALQAALEEAKTLDRVKVRDALRRLNVRTFYGQIKFGANGMNEARDMPILQVQGNVVKVLYPPAVANAELRAIER
jgi:branched-chain amino acid transport system substrate-binding protein